MFIYDLLTDIYYTIKYGFSRIFASQLICSKIVYLRKVTLKIILSFYAFTG